MRGSGWQAGQDRETGQAEKVIGLVRQHQSAQCCHSTTPTPLLQSEQTIKMVSPLSAILFPLLLGSAFGGCSFKMDENHSVNKDLDAAKYAAKMAIAHKGLDIETLKKRQAR